MLPPLQKSKRTVKNDLKGAGIRTAVTSNSGGESGDHRVLNILLY